MQKADFLNEQQKKLKQKVMEELLFVIGDNLEANQSILDPQSCADLIVSCLIMLGKYIFIGLIEQNNLNKLQAQQIISQFCETLAEEIIEGIKNE